MSWPRHRAVTATSQRPGALGVRSSAHAASCLPLTDFCDAAATASGPSEDIRTASSGHERHELVPHPTRRQQAAATEWLSRPAAWRAPAARGRWLAAGAGVAGGSRRGGLVRPGDGDRATNGAVTAAGAAAQPEPDRLDRLADGGGLGGRGVGGRVRAAAAGGAGSPPAGAGGQRGQADDRLCHRARSPAGCGRGGAADRGAAG